MINIIIATRIQLLRELLNYFNKEYEEIGRKQQVAKKSYRKVLDALNDLYADLLKHSSIQEDLVDIYQSWTKQLSIKARYSP